MKSLKIILFIFILFTTPILAQAVNEVSSRTNTALDLFNDLLEKNPWLATLIIIMGLFRTVAKPLSSIIHQIVNVTPTEKDNRVLAKIMKFFLKNPIGKTIVYILDWVTSIKIKPPSK